MHLCKQFNNSLLYIPSAHFQFPSNIINHTLPLLIIKYPHKQVSGLLIITIFMLIWISPTLPFEFLLMPLILFIFFRSPHWIRFIINLSLAVSSSHHWPISLIGIDFTIYTTINRNMFIICTQSVSVSVRVRKESSLEQFIVRWFYSRNHKRGWKSTLFNFSKVVIRVSI
jgi:hypothetical protein